MKRLFPRISLPFSFAALLLAVFCACGDDDDKYTSEPPRIATLQVTSLDGGSGVRVGQPFRVTAVQRQKGRNLYKAAYSWAPMEEGNISHRYNKATAVYDNDPADAEDVITISTPGKYNITFTGEYRPSGSTEEFIKKNGVSFSETAQDGTNVSYSSAEVLFRIKAQRTVTVLPAE